ncbi:MAG: hypothetical protein Q8P97_00860 [bacterium]|nr:hypothetical protein [bacterium]
MSKFVNKNRLDHNALRQLVRRLPKPSGIYGIGDSIFELYEAKKMNRQSWTSKVLRNLLVDARGSYDVYGKRARLDVYDKKAAIYLVRAIYKWPLGSAQGVRVESWFSNRFVPNEGKPRGAAELDICTLRGRTIEKIMGERFFKNRKNFLRYILSYSRMCSIKPFPVAAKDRPKLKKLPTPKNPYSAVCFSLTCKQFIRDYADDFSFHYITGIIRDDLVKSALAIKKNGYSYEPLFTSAYRFLGVPKNEVALDRRVYTYRYPGYFLLMPKLVGLLRNLARARKLPPKTLVHYFGSEDLIFKTDDFKKLGGLSRLLSAPRKLFGTNFSSEALRTLVDKKVPDGPELKIDYIEGWKKSIDGVLKAGGVSQIM